MMRNNMINVEGSPKRFITNSGTPISTTVYPFKIDSTKISCDRTAPKFVSLKCDI